MGSRPFFQADIGPDEIARLGGSTIEAIRASKDRDWLTQVMERGAAKKVKQLYAEGNVGGIMAIGGEGTEEGPVLGAIVVVVLYFLLARYAEISLIIQGSILVGIMLLAPQGIMGFVRRTRVYRYLLRLVTGR
jgi:uncharacterized protein (UPF0261 family)